MDSSTERGAELISNSLDSVVDVMKLELGLSTGAVAFFVHVVVEGHTAAAPTFILVIASLCFGFSAISCLQALAKVAVLKSTVRAAVWRGVEGLQKVLDGEAQKPLGEVTAVSRRMDIGFALGIIFSVVFLIAQFICNLQH